MGKRSAFERVPRDFYPTPREAVLPLLPHLEPATVFVEPCAGDGRLVDHLQANGHWCAYASDIEPKTVAAVVGNAATDRFNVDGATHYITNPPWSRSDLHAIIGNLASHLPSWLLFDADWLHTQQSRPFLPLLRKVVSVGRVKWIPDSKMTGKDNCCWYLFDAGTSGPVEFVGRA